ncbi:MAG: disulfide bond formation protein B [Pseudomonadota bacterium]
MTNTRTLLLLIAALCFGAVGTALYLQHAHDLLPCPLCVIQRYAFLFTGTFCLIAAGATRQRLWAGLALASDAVGVGYLAKHLWVLAHPGLSCGIDPMETFLNKIPTATYLPWLFRADGLCEDARDTVLGLSVPQWSAVAFTVVTLALLAALLRRR